MYCYPPQIHPIKARRKLSAVKLSALMSSIEGKYCLISTSYLAGLFDIFIFNKYSTSARWI